MRDLYELLKHLEQSQWNHKVFPIPKSPIMTRYDLQNMKTAGEFESRSTGSTGVPVIVKKNYKTMLWHRATNIREVIWRKWDISKTLAIINADVHKEGVLKNWGPDYDLLGDNIGKLFIHPLRGDLQSWLEEINPHYLFSFPSIIETLDLKKITNLIDIKSTGEKGGTMYSCAEAGTIAIQCPKNPEVYHVMENIILELGPNGEVIITDVTNPYITRYQNGDYAQWGECTCGRTLQTIKGVLGRDRNMVKLPDGTKYWPMVGAHYYRDISEDIKRYQVVQKSYKKVELRLVSKKLNPEQEIKIKKLVQEFLDYPFEVDIKYFGSFPLGKFEDFKCEI